MTQHAGDEINEISKFTEIGGEDSSALCLRVEGTHFHVYELSQDQFAIAAAGFDVLKSSDLASLETAKFEGEQRTESAGICSGELFTEDGEVLIPVTFRLERTEDELLYCTFDELPEESSRHIGDLVALLENDWADFDAADTTCATDEPSTNSGEDVPRTAHSGGAPSGGVVLETADGRQILPRDRRSKRSAERVGWYSRPAFRVGAGLLVASTFVVLAFGLLKRTGHSNTNESHQVQLPSLSAASPEAEEPSNASDGVVTEWVVEQAPIRGRVAGLSIPLLSERAGVVEQILVTKGQTISRGDVVVEISSGEAPVELRRLKSELKLAMVEAETCQVRLDIAEQKIKSALRQMQADVSMLVAELRESTADRQLASTQWEQIRPLAEKDNVGRKEVEQVQKKLAESNARYKQLRKSLTAKQEILGSSEPEMVLAAELEIPLQELRAEQKLAVSRVEYTKEQIEIQQSEMKPVSSKSDSAGEVTEILVSAGDSIEVGHPICKVQQGVTLAVDFTMPIDLRAHVQEGQEVHLRMLDSNLKLQGRIESIRIDRAGEGLEANAATMSVTVLLAGDNGRPQLPVGTIVELEALP